jgi:hypothetical protein
VGNAHSANARIDGGAAIDLSAERFELELRSKPKSPSILSLHGPIFALGTFRDPHLAVGQGALLRGGAAAALAAVNPFAALLPLIEAGRGEDTDCQRALRPVAGALDQTDESGILPPPPPAPERTKH